MHKSMHSSDFLFSDVDLRLCVIVSHAPVVHQSVFIEPLVDSVYLHVLYQLPLWNISSTAKYILPNGVLSLPPFLSCTLYFCFKSCKLQRHNAPYSGSFTQSLVSISGSFLIKIVPLLCFHHPLFHTVPHQPHNIKTLLLLTSWSCSLFLDLAIPHVGSDLSFPSSNRLLLTCCSLLEIWTCLSCSGDNSWYDAHIPHSLKPKHT